MPHVIWTRRAQGDLARLYFFLSEHSEAAALRAMNSIHFGVNNLSRYPDSGRLVSEVFAGRREWVIPFGKGAYVVAYDQTPSSIRILALRHSREQQ